MDILYISFTSSCTAIAWFGTVAPVTPVIPFARA